MLKAGDIIAQRFGPYVTRARVVSVNDHGATLVLDDTATLDPESMDAINAPNGDQLAPAGMGFLGRAHFPAAQVIDQA